MSSRFTRLTEILATLDAPVLVSGDGPDAPELRKAFPGRPTSPATVVETTGSAAGLAAALALAADHGTVVLAGPAPSAAPTLDLYHDLHVRGLTVVGIAPETNP